MTTQAETNTGNLKTAIRHAMELLSAGESGLAREQAEEILRQFPDEMNSQFVVAAAIRAQGHEEESLQRLKTLTEKAPDFALAPQKHTEIV